MLRTFRASSRSKRAIDQALAELYDVLQTGSFDPPDAESLTRRDNAAFGPGSKPVVELCADGRRFIYKVAEPALAAAETAAYELRRLGARPCIPALQLSLQLDEFGEARGSLKPFVEWDSELELAADSQTWSSEQRSVLLMEHAWEWFLDNLDTNTTQYRLFGSRQIPVNIDWDRAFASGGTSPMSRFAKYRGSLPNAHTFLYADYVEGRIDLAFDLLFREARRVAFLPKRAVGQALTKYAQVAFDDDAEREAFVQRMLVRHASILTETTSFVRDLVRERRLYAAPTTLRGRAKASGASLWRNWQIVLNGLLHSPLARAVRSVVTFVRARQHASRP